MAHTGDVEISEMIKESLSQVLSTELGSEKIDINIESGSKKGDNFVGIVYRVNGKLSSYLSNGLVAKKKSSINLILKVAPTSHARREQFYARACFLREIKMYDEVLPMFRQFQESNGIVPEEIGFFEYPKCYKTIDTEIAESLIFQDLKANNFEMFDRHQSITIDHVRLIMNTLGKYHALSFALRDQDPDRFRRYSQLEEVFSRTVDDNMRAYLKLLLADVYKSLDQEGDERLLDKMQELFQRDHITLIGECVKGEPAEPYAVLCHGDCWNNNILFKYNQDKKPVDLRLLDWQIARYASPVTDIVYYIFSCTTKPLRDKYYDHMLQTYHTSLSEMLTRLGSDPMQLFPYEALQAQLQQFGKYGLIMFTLLLPMLISTAEATPDLDEITEKLQHNPSQLFKPDATLFNKRMRDVVVDMDRLGYI